MKILVFSTLFPNSQQPNNAIFIKKRMAAVEKQYNDDVKVVAPVPFFPKLPFSSLFNKWQIFSTIPFHEWIDNLEVWHPRYFITPKVGMSFYGLFMFLSVLPQVKRVHRRFKFDIIDGHYIYPDGMAAVLLGKLFKVPVVLSARGTDINLYPKFPIIRQLIKYTLKNCSRCIAVCSDLKNIMTCLGIPEHKTDVIPNGIDPHEFYKIDKSKARNELGISSKTKMLLSVGSLIERKGHHLLIEALGKLHKNSSLFFETYIVGEGEWHSKLDAAIRANNLNHRVFLVGQVPNHKLVSWYNAADLFFLGSSREGWPNVVSEALACGIPVVATPVNGIPEILTSDEYGMILHERSADHFSETIPKAFMKSWNYEKIFRYGQTRTWDIVADEVYKTLSIAIATFQK